LSEGEKIELGSAPWYLDEKAMFNPPLEKTVQTARFIPRIIKDPVKELIEEQNDN